MSAIPNRSIKIAAAIALALGLAAASQSEGQDVPGTASPAEEPTDVVSKAYPVERYEALWTDSLFGSGPGTAPVAAPAPSNLSLVGVFEVDGVKHAVLMDTRTGVTEEVNSAAPNSGGGTLAAIENAQDLLQTRVQVQRGGSLVWVGYNLQATAETTALQAKADRVRALQERQRALAAAGQQDAGPASDPGDGSTTGQPEAKPDRPRVVVLPSTIPVTARPE